MVNDGTLESISKTCFDAQTFFFAFLLNSFYLKFIHWSLRSDKCVSVKKESRTKHKNRLDVTIIYIFRERRIRVSSTNYETGTGRRKGCGSSGYDSIKELQKNL